MLVYLELIYGVNEQLHPRKTTGDPFINMN